MSMRPSVQLRRVGGVQCMEHCRSVLLRLVQSNDRFSRALTKLSALEDLRSSPRPYGRSRQPRTLQASLERMNARERVGFRASLNHPE